MGIIRTPVRARKTCSHCGRIFRPRNNEHRFCWDCYRYAVGSSYIAAAVSLFKAVRSERR